MPLRDITPPVLLGIIRKIERRGAVETAKRMLQDCGAIFTYAVATGCADTNPAWGLHKVLKAQKKTHYAALTVEELPGLIMAMDSNTARLYPQTIRAMRLLMLTFVRTGELIQATWDEIAWETARWNIPAERMKMRRSHIVPLSRQALEVLEEQRAQTGDQGHIWPSVVRPAQHMSNNTILGALKRMGYQGRMTGHGFRALAMTAIKEKLGYRHEVVDRQLAHAPRSKIDAAYDRAQFIDERTKMMQDWADYLSRPL